MTKHVLVFLRLIGVFVNDSFTCFRVELPRSMPCGDIFLCRSITVTLLSMQVEQLGTLHRLQLS